MPEEGIMAAFKTLGSLPCRRRCRSGKTKVDSRDNPTLNLFLFTLSEGSVAYACSGNYPSGGGIS